jgi:hypothetical protein
MARIYKIINTNDPATILYIGSTTQKYLPARMSYHLKMVKAGVDRKLYNHMRTVPGPYKMEGMYLFDDKENIKLEEQKAIDLFKPPLNSNRAHHGVGLLPIGPTPKREKKQPDLTNPLVAKIVDYQRQYQATYQKTYYETKKPLILQKASNYNKLNNARIREQRCLTYQKTLAEKKYYCQSCKRACRSPSELVVHYQSDRHFAKQAAAVCVPVNQP